MHRLLVLIFVTVVLSTNVSAEWRKFAKRTEGNLQNSTAVRLPQMARRDNRPVNLTTSDTIPRVTTLLQKPISQGVASYAPALALIVHPGKRKIVQSNYVPSPPPIPSALPLISDQTRKDFQSDVISSNTDSIVNYLVRNLQLQASVMKHLVPLVKQFTDIGVPGTAPENPKPIAATITPQMPQTTSTRNFATTSHTASASQYVPKRPQVPYQVAPSIRMGGFVPLPPRKQSLNNSPSSVIRATPSVTSSYQPQTYLQRPAAASYVAPAIKINVKPVPQIHAISSSNSGGKRNYVMHPFPGIEDSLKTPAKQPIQVERKKPISYQIQKYPASTQLQKIRGINGNKDIFLIKELQTVPVSDDANGRKPGLAPFVVQFKDIQDNRIPAASIRNRPAVVELGKTKQHSNTVGNSQNKIFSNGQTIIAVGNSENKPFSNGQTLIEIIKLSENTQQEQQKNKPKPQPSGPLRKPEETRPDQQRERPQLNKKPVDTQQQNNRFPLGIDLSKLAGHPIDLARLPILNFPAKDLIEANFPSKLQLAGGGPAFLSKLIEALTSRKPAELKPETLEHLLQSAHGKFPRGPFSFENSGERETGLAQHQLVSQAFRELKQEAEKEGNFQGFVGPLPFQGQHFKKPGHGEFIDGAEGRPFRVPFVLQAESEDKEVAEGTQDKEIHLPQHFPFRQHFEGTEERRPVQFFHHFGESSENKEVTLPLKSHIRIPIFDGGGPSDIFGFPQVAESGHHKSVQLPFGQPFLFRGFRPGGPGNFEHSEEGEGDSEVLEDQAQKFPVRRPFPIQGAIPVPPELWEKIRHSLRPAASEPQGQIAQSVQEDDESDEEFSGAQGQGHVNQLSQETINFMQRVPVQQNGDGNGGRPHFAIVDPNRPFRLPVQGGWYLDKKK